MSEQLPPARDKLLFTPGPLTTSASVKEAMLHDAGTWDAEFKGVVLGVQRGLLRAAGVEGRGYEVVLMQGSGTYGVEAVAVSCVPRDGKLFVVSNGAYGERLIKILEKASFDYTTNMACRSCGR